MRALPWLFTGVVWWCAAGVTNGQDSGRSNSTSSCYSTLAQLVADVGQKDAFALSEYVLCPDTVFFMDDEEDGARDFVLRGNMKLLCGDDGLYSNNCTIRDGFTQLTCENSIYPGEEKENIYISGIAFTDSRASAFVGICPGEITFNDCSFEDHSRGVGAIKLEYNPTDDRRRHLGAQEVDHLSSASGQQQKRQMQEQTDERFLDVTFDGCVFEFNSYASGPAFIVHHGVISVDSPRTRLSVKNSVFHDNYFGDEGITPTTFCIDLPQEGSTVELENNCFLVNDLIGRGTVNVVHPDQIISANQNFGTFDAGIKCEFLHVDSTDVCIPYDLDQCPLQFEYTENDDLLSGPPIASPPLQTTPPSESAAGQHWLMTMTRTAIWGMVLCWMIG